MLKPGWVRDIYLLQRVQIFHEEGYASEKQMNWNNVNSLLEKDISKLVGLIVF